MALMKCGKYGKDVPDKASACPNCGAPVATAAQAEQAPRPYAAAGGVPAPARKKTGKWWAYGLVLPGDVGALWHAVPSRPDIHPLPGEQPRSHSRNRIAPQSNRLP